ncbi:hypothetical protein NNO_1194 [Hydrogenimonas sp.]|nr:hypothetical protein NNO_1194 [Hydrogenimonas sp.]
MRKLLQKKQREHTQKSRYNHIDERQRQNFDNITIKRFFRTPKY